jgi:hypothetical protein
VRLAIEAIRAVLPLVEQAVPEQVKPIREALSQLQLAYVRIGGGQGPEVPGEASEPTEPEKPEPGQAGPAQRSGRLWIPGQ